MAPRTPIVVSLVDDALMSASVTGWLDAEWPGSAANLARGDARWVACHDGRPVGMAGIAGQEDPLSCALLPCLVELYVAPAWRGRGIGRLLCRHVMAQARVRGLPALWLFTRDRQAWFQAQGWGEVTPAVLHTGRGLEWVTVMRLPLSGDADTSRPSGSGPQSTLAPERRTSAPHFSTSSFSSAANSAVPVG